MQTLHRPPKPSWTPHSEGTSFLSQLKFPIALLEKHLGPYDRVPLAPAIILASLSSGISAGLYAMSTTMPTSTLKRDEGRNNASRTCSSVLVTNASTVEVMTLGGGTSRRAC